MPGGNQMEKYEQMLNKLRNKEVETIELSKDEFLAFREVLVKDPQFKHFRGEAHQGGSVIFTFLDIPRS